jgi:hypothetical protein
MTSLKSMGISERRFIMMKLDGKILSLQELKDMTETLSDAKLKDVLLSIDGPELTDQEAELIFHLVASIG